MLSFYFKLIDTFKLLIKVKNLDLLVKMDQLNENQTIKNILYRRKVRREKRITFAVFIVISINVFLNFCVSN